MLGVADLADAVRLESAPQSIVESAASLLEKGIDHAEPVLRGLETDKPWIGERIAGLLRMEDGLQTRRMACAIVANAMMFHRNLATSVDGIDALPDLSADHPAPSRIVEEAWRESLNVSYWPIFGVASDILAQVPGDEAAALVERLQKTADAVSALGIDSSHDLIGRVFQRLIADRKYLATFYTSPPSAALLADLAVSKMRDVDWGDVDSLASLQIADFACGTGALLSAVYEQVARRHERAGCEGERLHKAMLEEVLYGCDVMPSAIHITGASLAGMEPSVLFDRTHLYTLAFGRQSDGSVSIGSLELLRPSAAMSLFSTSTLATRAGEGGQEAAEHVTTEIGDGEFDLVIMNPPFTRSTNHKGAHGAVVNPAFAAFGASADDQSEMGDRLNELGEASCYHGNAGLASAFAALAHQKLKVGGVLALLLPLSAAGGLSWSEFRRMLRGSYSELDIVSINADRDGIAFSADTGLGECLIVGRKTDTRPPERDQVRYSSVSRRPRGMLEAEVVAKEILDGTESRRLEDRPNDGMPSLAGSSDLCSVLLADSGIDGAMFKVVRVADYSVAQTAHALGESRLSLPCMSDDLELPTAPLRDVGAMGLVHRDITGPAPRGPFDKHPPSKTAMYPALWNHDAGSETRMVVEPDSQLTVRPGMEDKAARAWETAGHVHQNLAFRFNSQPLAASYTETRSLGGSGWPNLNFEDRRFDMAYCVWANSTLGLLAFWWNSNRQQTGRGVVTIRSVELMPVLDLRTLTEAQLGLAVDVFDDFRLRTLQPAYLADLDDNRALLDRRVVCDLLGFDEGVYDGVRGLATRWCAEPSVHGGKSNRGSISCQ